MIYEGFILCVILYYFMNKINLLFKSIKMFTLYLLNIVYLSLKFLNIISLKNFQGGIY